MTRRGWTHVPNQIEVIGGPAHGRVVAAPRDTFVPRMLRFPQHTPGSMRATYANYQLETRRRDGQVVPVFAYGMDPDRHVRLRRMVLPGPWGILEYEEILRAARAGGIHIVRTRKDYFLGNIYLEAEGWRMQPEERA